MRALGANLLKQQRKYQAFGCSQNSRFPTAGQGERSSVNETARAPISAGATSGLRHPTALTSRSQSRARFRLESAHGHFVCACVTRNGINIFVLHFVV